jgi:hypothetical protein
MRSNACPTLAPAWYFRPSITATVLACQNFPAFPSFRGHLMIRSLSNRFDGLDGEAGGGLAAEGAGGDGGITWVWTEIAFTRNPQKFL